MKAKSIITTALLLCTLSAGAQQAAVDSLAVDTLTADKGKKAWELGIGGTVFQFSRVSYSNFTRMDDGYGFDLDLNHAVWGGGIYAARELNKHFYVDLQGSIGVTNKSIEGKNKLLAMAGVGLQWRLGEYFHSKYIDPYLRAGVNYMYKDFKILYDGNEGPTPDEMSWIMSNFGNKEGRDKKHLMPISLGGDVNMWLNDRIGIGLQADYLLMPYKQVANSLQGTARLIWRIGGDSKKPKPVMRYVDREVEKVVEKIVEKEVPVERIIRETQHETLYDMFDQIYFEFDRYDITSESHTVLDKIAAYFKQDTSRRYLITGQTDSRGNAEYNLTLSRNRAATVVKELLKRGVPEEMIKYRGIGKKIAEATPDASNDIRRGDRKITVELVTNDAYWNYLK